MVAEARARLSLDASQFDNVLKKTAKGSEKTMGPSMKRIGGMIGAAFSVRAIYQFAQAALSTADQVDNLAKEVDLGVESVQSLKVVADEAGISFETLRPAINASRRAAEEAKAGNEGLIAAYQKLGISVDDLRSMNTEQMFEAVSKSIAANRDNADVMSASTKILGAESTRLLGVITELGETGFDELNKRMKESGQIIGEDVISELDQAEERISRFMNVVKNSAITALGDMIGVIEDFYSESSDLDKAWLEHTKEIDRQIEESKRKAQAAIEAQAAAQRAILEDIAALEKELAGYAAEKVPAAERLTQLNADLADLEQELAGLSGDTVENYRNQLKLERDIKLKKDEIMAVEAEIEKADAPARKAREQAAKELEAIQERYNKHLWQSQDITERIKTTEGVIYTLKTNIQSLIERGMKGSREHMEAVLELAIAENLLVDLKNDQLKGQKEILDLTTEQVENIKELRDHFKGMSRDDIKDFAEDLRFMADQIRGIIAPDIGWIKDLEAAGRIRFSGLTRGQAGQMARAIREFVDVLNVGVAGVKLDAKWLKDLEALGAIQFNSLTRGQASQMAGAIVELFDGLKKVGAMQNLQQVLDVLTAAGALGPGGKYQIEITMPQGMGEGVPLLVPAGMNDNLASLARSAAVIAEMKGVSVY